MPLLVRCCTSFVSCCTQMGKKRRTAVTARPAATCCSLLSITPPNPAWALGLRGAGVEQPVRVPRCPRCLDIARLPAHRTGSLWLLLLIMSMSSPLRAIPVPVPLLPAVEARRAAGTSLVVTVALAPILLTLLLFLLLFLLSLLLLAPILSEAALQIVHHARAPAAPRASALSLPSP